MAIKYCIEPNDDEPDPIRDFPEWYCTLVTAHRRYSIGHHAFGTVEGIRNYEIEHGGAIARAKLEGLFHYVYLYDHSGLSLALDASPDAWVHRDWDAGRLGFIYMDPAVATKKLGREPEPGELDKILRQEFDCIAAYVEGDSFVLYAVETDEDGDPADDWNREPLAWGRFAEMEKAKAELEAGNKEA